MSDKIRVAIKLRPLIAREKADNSSVYWRVSDDNSIFLIEPVSGKSKDVIYSFDHVFNENVDNATIFETVAKPIVEAAVKGFNGTIFAYGQTSSGKTYTMLGTSSEAGIIPLAIQHIFDCISNTPGREFLLRASYIELYNEQVNDLLTRKGNLKIREPQPGEVVVADLKEEVAHTPEKVMDLMKRGEKYRRFGETNMNDRSSRSHTIFRIIIESREAGESDGAIQVSHLNLVDLAGSERVEQTGATGERFKEGCSINRSLLTLGVVIAQLTDDTESHVRYRDSKLTRILQCSLGGNAHTSIICTVTPASVEETTCTLNFASRAKNIKNKPQVNEVLTDAALLKRYTRQISLLQEQLERNSRRPEDLTEMENRLQEERQRNEELQSRINRLKQQLIVSALPVSNTERLTRRRTWCAPRGNYRMSYFPTIKESPLDTIIELDTSLPSSPVVSESSFTSTPLEEFELQLLDEECKSLSDDGDNTSLSASPTFETPCYVTRRRKVNISPVGNVNVTLVDDVSESACDQGCQTDIILPSVINLNGHMLEESCETPPQILRERERYFQKEYEELREYTRLEKLFGCVPSGPAQKKVAEEYEMLKKAYEESSNKLEYSEGVISDLKCENEKLKGNLEESRKKCEELNKLLQPTEELNNILLKFYNQKSEMEKLIRDQTATIRCLESERNDFEMQLNLLKQSFKARENELVNSLKDAWETISEMEKEIQELANEKCKEEIEEKTQVVHSFEKSQNFKQSNLNTEIPELLNFNDDDTKNMASCGSFETVIKSENIVNTCNNETEFDTSYNTTLHETINICKMNVSESASLNTSVSDTSTLVAITTDNSDPVNENVNYSSPTNLHKFPNACIENSVLDHHCNDKMLLPEMSDCITAEKLTCAESNDPEQKGMKSHRELPKDNASLENIDQSVLVAPIDMSVEDHNVSDLLNTITCLNKKIEEYEHYIYLVKSDSSSMDIENVKLKQDISKINQKLQENDKIIQISSQTISKYEEECKVKDSRIRELLDIEASLKKRVQDNECYIDSLKIDISSLKNALSRKEGEKEKEIYDLRKNILEKNNGVESLSETVSDLLKKSSLKDDKISELCNTNLKLTNEVIEHEDENSTLKLELSAANVSDISELQFKLNDISMIDFSGSISSLKEMCIIKDLKIAELLGEILQLKKIKTCDETSVLLKSHELSPSDFQYQGFITPKIEMIKSIQDIPNEMSVQLLPEVSNEIVEDNSMAIAEHNFKDYEQKSIKIESSFSNTDLKMEYSGINTSGDVPNLESACLNNTPYNIQNAVSYYIEKVEKYDRNNEELHTGISDIHNYEESESELVNEIREQSHSELNKNSCCHYMEEIISKLKNEISIKNEQISQIHNSNLLYCEKLKCKEQYIISLKNKMLSCHVNDFCDQVNKMKGESGELNSNRIQANLSNQSLVGYTITEKEFNSDNSSITEHVNTVTYLSDDLKGDEENDELFGPQILSRNMYESSSSGHNETASNVKEFVDTALHSNIIIYDLNSSVDKCLSFINADCFNENSNTSEKNYSMNSDIVKCFSDNIPNNYTDTYTRSELLLTEDIKTYDRSNDSSTFDCLGQDVTDINKKRDHLYKILKEKDEEISALTNTIMNLKVQCTNKDAQINKLCNVISYLKGQEYKQNNIVVFSKEVTCNSLDQNTLNSTMKESSTCDERIIKTNECNKFARIESKYKPMVESSILELASNDITGFIEEINEKSNEILCTSIKIHDIGVIKENCDIETLDTSSCSFDKIEVSEPIVSEKEYGVFHNHFSEDKSEIDILLSDALQIDLQTENVSKMVLKLKEDCVVRRRMISELQNINFSLNEEIENYKICIELLQSEISNLNHLKYSEDEVTQMKNEWNETLHHDSQKIVQFKHKNIMPSCSCHLECKIGMSTKNIHDLMQKYSTAADVNDIILFLETKCDESNNQITNLLQSLSQLERKSDVQTKIIDQLMQKIMYSHTVTYKDDAEIQKELIDLYGRFESYIAQLNVDQASTKCSEMDKEFKETQNIMPILSNEPSHNIGKCFMQPENCDNYGELSIAEDNESNRLHERSLNHQDIITASNDKILYLGKDCCIKDQKTSEFSNNNLSQSLEKLVECEKSVLNQQLQLNRVYSEAEVTEIKYKIDELSRKESENQNNVSHFMDSLKTLENECSKKDMKICELSNFALELSKKVKDQENIIETLKCRASSLSKFKYSEEDFIEIKNELLKEKNFSEQNLIESISSLKENISMKDVYIKKLRDNVADLTTKIKEYELNVEKLKSENARLANFKYTEIDILDMKNEIEKLSKESLNSKITILSLTENIHDLENKCCEKDEKIGEHLISMSQLNEKVKELEQHIEFLESKVSSLSIFKYSEEDWNTIKNELQQERDLNEQTLLEIASLKSVISLKDKTEKELKVVEAKLMKQVEEYELEIEKLKSQVVCLKEFKYTEDEVAHMKIEIETLLKETCDTKSSMISLNENMLHLENKCSKKDEEITEHLKSISQSNKKVKELEEHIESLNLELSSMRVFKYTEEDWTTMKTKLLQEKDLNEQSIRETVSSLEKNMSIKDANIHELKDIEAHLIKKIKESELEIEELKSQIACLNSFKHTDGVHMKDEIEKLLKENIDNKSSIVKLTENVSALENKCCKKDEEITKHLKSISQFSEKVQEFEQHIKSLNLELSSLRVFKYSEEDWTTMKKELLREKDLNEQSFREDISSLKRDINLRDTNIIELENIKGQLIKQIEEFDLKIEAQKSEIVDLSVQLTNANFNVKKLEENISVQNKECYTRDEKIADLLSNISELNEKVNQFEAENNSLNDKVISLCKLKYTESDVTEMKEKVVELSKKILNNEICIEKLTANISDLEKECSDKAERIICLLNDTVELKEKLLTSEKLVKELDSKVKSLTCTEDNFNKLKSEVSDLHERIQERDIIIQNFSENKSALTEECTMKDAKITELSKTISESNENLKEYKTKNEMLKSEISTLQRSSEAEFCETKKHITELQQLVVEKDKSIQNLNKKLSTLQSEYCLKDNKISELLNIKLLLTKKIEELEKYIESLKIKVSHDTNTGEELSRSITDVSSLKKVNVSTQFNSVLDSEVQLNDTIHESTDCEIGNDDCRDVAQGSSTENDLSHLKHKISELLKNNASLMETLEDGNNHIISLISEFSVVKQSDDYSVCETKNSFSLYIQALKKYIFSLQEECSTKSDRISELENAVFGLSLKLNEVEQKESSLSMHSQSRDERENMGDNNESLIAFCDRDLHAPSLEKNKKSPLKENSVMFKHSEVIQKEQMLDNEDKISLIPVLFMKTSKHDEVYEESSEERVGETFENEVKIVELLKLECKLKEEKIAELLGSISFYNNEIKNKDGCIVHLNEQISSLKKYKYTEEDITEMKVVIDKLTSELSEKNDIINFYNRKTVPDVNDLHPGHFYEDKLKDSSDLRKELENVTSMLEAKVNEIASYRKTLTNELVSLYPSYKEKCDEWNLNILLVELLTSVMSKEKEMCSLIEGRKENEVKDLQNQLTKCEEILRDLTDRESKRESWVKHLETENETLQCEINDCKNKNDNLICKLNSLIEQNKLILQEKEEYSLKICKLESSLLTSETEVDLVKTKLNKMCDNYNSSASIIDSLNKRIEQLEKEENMCIKNLKSMLNDVKGNYEREIEELNKKVSNTDAVKFIMNDKQNQEENFESALIAEQEKCNTLLEENLSLKQRIVDIEDELVTYKMRCDELGRKLERAKDEILESTDKNNILINEGAQTRVDNCELLKMENTLVFVKRSLSCILNITSDTDPNIETMCNMLTEKLHDFDVKLNAAQDLKQDLDRAVAEKVRLDEENESMSEFIKEQENSLYLYYQRSEELKHELEVMKMDNDNLICMLQIKEEEIARLKIDIESHRSDISSSLPMQVKQFQQENSQLKKQVSQLKEELAWLKQQSEGSDNAMIHMKAEMKAKYNEFQKQISVLNSVKHELELENKQLKISYNEIKESSSHGVPGSTSGVKSFDTVGTNTDKECTSSEHCCEKLEEDVKNLNIELVSRDAKITVLQLQMQGEKTNCKKKVNELQKFVEYYKNKVAELKSEVAQKNVPLKSCINCKQNITKMDQCVQVDTTTRSLLPNMPITSGVVQEHNLNKLMMKNKNLTRERSNLQDLCEQKDKRIREMQRRLESCRCTRIVVNPTVGSSETSHSTRPLSPAEIDGQEGWSRFVRDKENCEKPKESSKQLNEVPRRALSDNNK